MRLAFALLAVLLACHGAAAQSYTWAGGASGSWQNPANWTPQGVPGAGQTATFTASASVTLDADVTVGTVALYSGPTTAQITISSAQNRFTSIGRATASYGALTILARVDACGTAEGSGNGNGTDSSGGRVSLQNVGYVNTVEAERSPTASVALNGSPLAVGYVSANARGSISITGSVAIISSVTVDTGVGGGNGSVVVTSTAPGTRIGTIWASDGGTVDLRGADGVVVTDIEIGLGIAPGLGTVLVENATFGTLGNATINRRVIPIIKVGGTLRLGFAASAGGRIEATRPGATVVFGPTIQVSDTMVLAGGLNARVDGPVVLSTRPTTLRNEQPATFLMEGGTFTVSAGARLRAESFAVRGTGSFVVDGEVFVASSIAAFAGRPVVAVAVPARIGGTLAVELAAADNGAAPRVTFAGLTAGGALAFTAPGGFPAPFPLGATFTPVAYTSLSGTFSPVTFPTVQGELDWTFALEPTRVRLTVIPGQVPMPVRDEVATDEDVPAVFDPAANDTPPQGGGVTTVAVGPATLGQATLGAGGTVTFTPAPNVSGQETFPYTVRGANGREATGAVHVVVRPVNDAPVAADDAAQTQAAVLVSIDVLANDTDVEGSDLQIVSVEDPEIGNAFRSEGRVLYSPPVGFAGTVTFGYVVTDGVLTDTGQVAVVVRRFTASEPGLVTISAPSPNPSAGPVSVHVELPTASRVSVDVFDVLGRRVPSASPASLPPGAHAVQLGAGLRPGTYFYRIRVEGGPSPVAAAGQFVVVR